MNNLSETFHSHQIHNNSPFIYFYILLNYQSEIYVKCLNMWSSIKKNVLRHSSTQFYSILDYRELNSKIIKKKKELNSKIIK